MPDTPTGLPLRSATDLISPFWLLATTRDRKSTRLNSSHDQISYAVFCLKKKNARHTGSRPKRNVRPAGCNAPQLVNILLSSHSPHTHTLGTRETTPLVLRDAYSILYSTR